MKKSWQGSGQLTQRTLMPKRESKKKANKVVTYIIANKGFEAGCARI